MTIGGRATWVNMQKDAVKHKKEALSAHDSQLNQIYEAMENLFDEKAAQRKWSERERIGFKK
jgi:hypothetical protein